MLGVCICTWRMLKASSRRMGEREGGREEGHAGLQFVLREPDM